VPRRTDTRELAVWANGERVGEWRLPARGRTEFVYDAKWMAAPEGRALSLSLPFTFANVPLRGAPVENYFDNLLPDSDAIRRRLQARFHTRSSGVFDLLSAIGRDCVGAVQLLPAGETPADIHRIEAHALSDSQLAAELAGLTSPASPALEENEFRISIAGAQEKTAFLRHHDQWCRPIGSTPTTHIFKLPLGLVGNRQADMRTSVENEFLCARLVAALGIPVAPCDMGEFGAYKVLIVERFDRQLHSSGKYWLRLMQEDFAQATGTPWHRKYQAEGGPGLLEIAAILGSSVESQRDLETLFKAQLAFFLLAATDGHAKNFSLRILPQSRYRLTPLYDVLSAWPVIGKKANELPPQKVRLAMALPGERPRYHLAQLQRRHFEMFGARIGLGRRASTLIDEMMARAPAAIEQVQRALPRRFPQALAARIFEGIGSSLQVLGS
jgi:serine/threonine-protein kinase HipA